MRKQVPIPVASDEILEAHSGGGGNRAGKLSPVLCTVLSIELRLMSLIRMIDRTAEQRV
jgi:hypothetical protein